MTLSSCVSIAAAVLLLLITAPAAAAGDPPTMIGMPGCNTSCGNVSVPYPFGMGLERCYWPGFNLSCDHGSEPPRLLLGASPFQVVDISLENVTVRALSRWSLGDVNRRWSLGNGVPYILKPQSNEFILTGCNKQATLVKDGGIVSGCVSFCATASITTGGLNQTYYYDTPNGAYPNSKICSNMGCCQSSIIIGSASYAVELSSMPNNYSGHTSEDREMHMPRVFIAEVGWFCKRIHPPWVPVVLQWAVPHGVPNTNLEKKQACSHDAAQSICKSNNSYCRDETSIYLALQGYSCHCQEGYKGNPYLTGGCQDIKECDQKEKYGCFGECEELQGSFKCRCPKGIDGNSSRPGGCIVSTNTKGKLGLIVGLSVASGPYVLLLVHGALLITRDFKQRKAKALRQKFFNQNRGQLLKQLVSHRADIAERMLIPLEELEKATNNFDQLRRLGGGGHGTVYKGILSDLHVVAIKKSNIVVKREIDEFINEVSILSQINHKNIVKLHGCCLETEVPLLAYDFISNGTLSDHLHREAPRSLPWKDRLRITREISKALAYLHSAISVPIIHRDIKPSNILIDDALTAKVSDFGASRYIPIDQTGVKTAVQGTIGYLDPAYYYTRRLTESSDIYSFGVLLVELLTRKKPYLCMSSEDEPTVTQFVTRFEDDNLAEILDPQVVEEGGNEVETVATLAVSCMNLLADERPTMRQVEIALEALQAPKEHVLQDFTGEKYIKKDATKNYQSASRRTKRGEESRCPSLEEEFISSARYRR